MKKATMLWMPALLLGWFSATIPAQAQEETSKKKITIILKEEGKASVYEYNSEEEVAADKRLNGKMLQFDVLEMGAASLESLPELAQALLREPPLPPAPAEPSAPAEQRIPAEPATPPAPPAVVGQPPVSEEATEWLEALQIYPNPSADAVHMHFRSINGGPAVLKLVDMQGKVVYEENIPDAGLTIDRTIKAPGGKKGVFILQLEQEGSKISRRVLLH